MHTGFLDEIKSKYGMASIYEESVLDMVSHESAPYDHASTVHTRVQHLLMQCRPIPHGQHVRVQAREDFTAEEIIYRVVRVQAVVRAHQGRK